MEHGFIKEFQEVPRVFPRFQDHFRGYLVEAYRRVSGAS